MKLNNAIPTMIAGVGYYVPETVITNDDIAKLVDTNDEWIVTRTGIKERRIVCGNETAAELGIEAAKRALKNANMKAEDVDVIIAATSVPTHLYPSCGCEIQGAIGATKAFAFDVSAACSGLIYSMNIAKAYISSGMYENILIVATDANSRFVDWQDRSICVLFGDGAGAMVVKKSDDGVEDILAIDAHSDGTKFAGITMPLWGKNCPLVEPCKPEPLLIGMNGREVYKFVMNIMPDAINKCLKDAGLEPKDVDYLISHQANLRIIEGLQERLGYSDEKVISNIDKYGNTSAASVPIALVEAVKEGKVKLPSTAIICGFGAGLTWGTAIVRLREGIVKQGDS